MLSSKKKMHLKVPSTKWPPFGSGLNVLLKISQKFTSGKLLADGLVLICGKTSGPRFNIKISSCQYRKSHCGDKTVVRSSYLHNGISYTAKIYLYWIRALYFADTIFKYICLNENHVFPISLFFVLRVHWHWSKLWTVLIQCWSITPNGITRLQWVN